MFYRFWICNRDWKWSEVVKGVLFVLWFSIMIVVFIWVFSVLRNCFLYKWFKGFEKELVFLDKLVIV